MLCDADASRRVHDHPFNPTQGIIDHDYFASKKQIGRLNMITTTNNNPPVVSCLINHRPVFVIAMADTVAVCRPGFVDHRVSWGRPGRIASGHPAEHRPCHPEPEHTGLERNFLVLDG